MMATLVTLSGSQNYYSMARNMTNASGASGSVPSSIKAGPNHPNYRHGLETLPAKHQRSVTLAELRAIETDLINKGLIRGNRIAGRKPTVG